MIRAEALEFRYGNKPPIFQDFHWYAARGQAWAVIGASGCGKSTLLYLLAGLLKPTAGRVMVGGQPLAGPRPRTGLILQDYGLLPWATIRENVRLGLRIRRFYGPDGIHAPAEGLPAGAEEQVEAWLEKLGISSVANSYPGQVSGGQRQRTAIARTLVLEPDLLLMDEPFASLDLPTREGLQALVYELQQERDGRRVVMVVNGLSSERERAQEAARLMEWGLRSFENVSLFSAGETVDHARIVMGQAEQIAMVSDRDIVVTVPRAVRNDLSVRVSYMTPLIAPVRRGDRIGTLHVDIPRLGPLEYPLYAAQDVDKLGLLAGTLAKAMMMVGLGKK